MKVSVSDLEKMGDEAYAFNEAAAPYRKAYNEAVALHRKAYNDAYENARKYVRETLREKDADTLTKFDKLAAACSWDLHYGPSGDHFDDTGADCFEDGVVKLKELLGEFEEVESLGRWIYVGMDSEYVSDSTQAFEGYEYLADDGEEECIEWQEGEAYMEFSLPTLLVPSELALYLR